MSALALSRSLASKKMPQRLSPLSQQTRGVVFYNENAMLLRYALPPGMSFLGFLTRSSVHTAWHSYPWDHPVETFDPSYAGAASGLLLGCFLQFMLTQPGSKVCDPEDILKAIDPDRYQPSNLYYWLKENDIPLDMRFQDGSSIFDLLLKEGRRDAFDSLSRMRKLPPVESTVFKAQSRNQAPDGELTCGKP